MFGIDLHDYYNVPWEKARSYVAEEFDQLKAELRGRWNAALGPDNELNADAISGDSTPATRYVANTGPSNKPKWDLVNLLNGVKNRLKYVNFTATTAPSLLLGRGDDAAGDWQEITLDPATLEMNGTELRAIGGGTPFFIPAGSTFTVPEYVQTLFTIPIDVEGFLVVDGILVWVD